MVLCVDEKSGIQALDRSQPVLPMMPGIPERRSHDYIRHGTTDLFAAFDVADGTVISQLRRHHRAEEFKKFLARIDKRRARRARGCTWSATTSPPTRPRSSRPGWPATPGSACTSRPPDRRGSTRSSGGSAILTEQMIRRGVHKSVQALEADIRDLDRGLERRTRRPFTWTKTADEILDSLAKYLARISGAAY